MTNQQIGKFRKYNAQKETIFAYLALVAGLTNYKRDYHSVDMNIVTYWNCTQARENIENFEKYLAREGLSVHKLRKMARVVRLAIRGRMSKTPADLLTKAFCGEFIREHRNELYDLTIKDSGRPTPEYVRELTLKRSLRRRRAIKGLSHHQQVLASIKNLKRVYLTLKPGGTFEEFAHRAMDKIEADINYMPKLIEDCRKIDPTMIM